MSTYRLKIVTGAKIFVQDFEDGSTVWIRLTTGNPTTGTTPISGGSESTETVYLGIVSEFSDWLTDFSHPPSSPH